MDRRRRRIGCWIIAVTGLVVLVAVWLLLPRIVCWIANTGLPRELDQRAILLSLDPACDRLPTPPLLLEVEPSLLRRIACEASGRWIPPGMIRHGLGAVGSLRGDNGTSVPWHVIAVDGASPPRIGISLTPLQTDMLIAGPNSRKTVIVGFTISIHITAAELAELPPTGPERLFRFEAAGSLHLEGNNLSMDVPVRRLAARLAVGFTSAETGWRPEIKVVIDALDAPLPKLLDDASWRSLLAAAANDRIEDVIGDRTLPPWFPTDLRLSAVVR